MGRGLSGVGSGQAEGRREESKRQSQDPVMLDPDPVSPGRKE